MVRNPGVAWPTQAKQTCAVRKVNPKKRQKTGAPTANHEEHCLPPFYHYTHYRRYEPCATEWLI